MIASRCRLGLLTASLALLSACSVEPTSAPKTPSLAPATNLLGGVVGVLTNPLFAPGLQRTTPLPVSITVTKTIGQAGGTLSIPEAGVTVMVPSGALNAPTVVTMTARAGSLVAYDFAPHGITFARPLVFTQNLNGTTASLLNASSLQLGYYTDPSLLNQVGGVVSELLAGNVNLLNWTFTANINHFSGYMMGCGRDEPPQ